MFDDIFAPPSAPPGQTIVTFICAGNICRSPLAEKLFRFHIERLSNEDIFVQSAGHQAVVGAGMEPQPAAIVEREGGDPTHRAQQVNAELLKSSALVLTMTRDQRSLISQEWPFALKRTFTLVEFNRILRELPDSVPSMRNSVGRPLFEIVYDASRFRGMVPLGDDDDIEDPYRRSIETHERVGLRIAGLVRTLASSLAAAT